MGVPEDLLAAAKQCLAERGYAKTTVRDIIAISGSNLAAINYHFRSKDALLNQAMIETTGDAVQEILKAMPEGPQNLETFWEGMTRSFRERPELWRANVVALAQAPHSPELRGQLAEGQARARAELAETLSGDEGEQSKALLTLVIGMLVQWMIDSDHAPTAGELVRGLGALNSQQDRHQDQ
ncbi:TetR/AcrR family transcriptional regulator [Streptosporangium sp. NPDC000396]|uniref:TetR/AcrR family transcriptional regulator n=1 Tax=Streptosporangium sp. NPDC000396 TaxID=3366185 RepID=UPI0036C8CA14